MSRQKLIILSYSIDSHLYLLALLKEFLKLLKSLAFSGVHMIFKQLNLEIIIRFFPLLYLCIFSL